MEALPAEFTFDGCQFRQLARQGEVLLLERTKHGHRCASYEVVLVQRHAAVVIHGRHYPARESMPPTAAWGSLGWSCIELKSARKKFNELVTRRAQPHPSPTPFPAGTLEAV